MSAVKLSTLDAREAAATGPVFSVITDSPRFGTYEAATVAFTDVAQSRSFLEHFRDEEPDEDGLQQGVVPRNAAAVAALLEVLA